MKKKSGRSKIFCIMFSGARLSDAACDALFQAACDCVQDEKEQKKVRNDDVMGVVYTEFDYGSTGDINGIVFRGEIETEEGETKVEYIVPRFHIEKVREEVRQAKWLHEKLNLNNPEWN